MRQLTISYADEPFDSIRWKIGIKILASIFLELLEERESVPCLNNCTEPKFVNKLNSQNVPPV